MRSLVLGGSGFIGSHLVDALLAEGGDVRVFDRSPERFRPKPAGIEFVQGSISDSAALAEVLVDVDVVYHLASTTVPTTANLDPVADIEGNLVSAVKLIELMRAADMKRIVYLSSGGTVYGIPTVDPVPETHALNPINSYGIVKVAVENYLMMETHLHGLRPLILRASNPYGPRQGHSGVQGVVGTFLGRIARGETIQIWGDGSVVRDFIHVSDLVKLAVAAERAGLEGVLNAGSGEGRSIMEVLDTIRRLSREQITPVFKPSRRFDVPRIVLDVTRAHAALGWSPETGLEDGIAETWAWLKAQEG